MLGPGLKNVYLHHSSNPEAAVDGVDADDGGGGVVDHSVEKPDVITHHYE